jgi:site-specific recombinase XerD
MFSSSRCPRASISCLGKPVSYIRRRLSSRRRQDDRNRPPALRSSFALASTQRPGTCRRMRSRQESDVLVPVTQPSDLREARVGQLVKRVLYGLSSEETRRAYSHALKIFLRFCDREGNPMLSAARYRLLRVGEGKSSSAVGVHLAALKALTRAAVMAELMPAETAASINDGKGAPRRGNRIGKWLTQEQPQELLSLPDRERLKGKRDNAILAVLLGCENHAT